MQKLTTWKPIPYLSGSTAPRLLLPATDDTPGAARLFKPARFISAGPSACLLPRGARARFHRRPPPDPLFRARLSALLPLLPVAAPRQAGRLPPSAPDVIPTPARAPAVSHAPQPHPTAAASAANTRASGLRTYAPGPKRRPPHRPGMVAPPGRASLSARRGAQRAVGVIGARTTGRARVGAHWPAPMRVNIRTRHTQGLNGTCITECVVFENGMEATGRAHVITQLRNATSAPIKSHFYSDITWP